MLIKKPHDIKPSEITDESHYLNRRALLQSAGLMAGGLLLPSLFNPQTAEASVALDSYPNLKASAFSTDEKITTYDNATSYCNFYEFGTGKSDPSQYASKVKPKGWEVTVAGACDKPGQYTLEDILKPHALEERIYRLRCVEAWSMVVPWVGFPLVDLLKRFQPHSRAKYVRFETLYDPNLMPGQKRNVLDWPYVEGLRIDEATHPLALVVIGMYGKQLPMQNGAPLRLVLPWKYGFKSIKSIVKIEFVEKPPRTSWNLSAPREYGFYANVNPAVSHPRWSQSRERRLGSWGKQKTLPFNGYAEQVAHLYKGMDLKKQF
ncbi:MAG: protein-methionine-sulfoxide reductase catalytic subunit MsrP [Candidatus Polarisedimenticolaceae bacterium]|nr:protein-methionine-sulfoxide reductase catalytic subunit MsrP [Candidatus Polarisedimenticolaceae bacterium]